MRCPLSEPTKFPRWQSGVYLDRCNRPAQRSLARLTRISSLTVALVIPQYRSLSAPSVRSGFGSTSTSMTPNLSLESYVDWTFNPDGAVQPTLGMALTYDRDDYETNTHLRPSVGVNVEYGALRGHLEVVLVEGQWDTSGNVMFQPKRGLYAGLTRSARERDPLTNARTQPQLQLETGWKRNGLSPYMALGADSWRIGQKLRTASHEFDVYLRNERDEAEVRVGWRLSW